MGPYLSVLNPSGAEPIPDTPLLNDRKDQVFAFVPGKTYRLRIVAMTAIAMFNVWIDGHQMTVVEADGIDVEPYNVTSLSVASAQRYSVLVTALNSTEFNYKLNAAFDLQMFDNPPASLDPLVTATLQYKQGAPMFAPTSMVDFESFDDTELIPLIPLAAVKPDVSIEFAASFGVYNDGLNHGTFNQIVYRFPKVIPLLTAVTTGQDASKDVTYGPSTNTKVLALNNWVQIVVRNQDPTSHPFHLHGHVFQVISRGLMPFDENALPPAKANPVRRDTVVVPGVGYVILRFKADNPGVWLFHCHVEWHMSAGLVAQFVTAPAEIQNSIVIPQIITDQCKDQGIPTSGNAAGLTGQDFTGIAGVLTPFPDTFTTNGVVALLGTIASALVGLVAVVWFSRS